LLWLLWLLMLLLLRGSLLPAAARAASDPEAPLRSDRQPGAEELDRELEDARWEAQFRARTLKDGILTHEEMLRGIGHKLLDPDQHPFVLMEIGADYEELARVHDELAILEADLAWHRCQIDTTEACPEPGALDTTAGDQDRLSSIQVYRGLLAEHPEFVHRDQIELHMALTWAELDRWDEAREGFERLIHNHPDSPRVADAQLALAERLFDQGELGPATARYQAIVDGPPSEARPVALHRLAWCHYNRSHLPEAIATMERVIAEADADGAAHRLSMRREAIRDLALFHTLEDPSPGGLRQLWDHYQHQPYHREMVELMANHYFDHGQPEAACQIYGWLISQQPLAPQNPRYLVRIIEEHRRHARFPEAVASLEQLLADHGPGSSWRSAHADDTPLIASTDGQIYEQHRQLALAGYSLALKRRNKAWMATTEALFASFLEHHPDSEHGAEMHYWHAESLYKLRRFDRAAHRYAALLDHHPDGELARDAAVNMIVAIESHLENLAPPAQAVVEASFPQATGSPAAAPPEPRPLGDWQQGLVQACDLFVARWPDDPLAQRVAFKAASLFDEHDQIREAATRYRTLVQLEPSSDSARLAVHRVLAGYEALEDYENLHAAASDFLGQDALNTDPVFRAELATIHHNATLMAAQLITRDAIASGDEERLRQGASRYLAFADTWPDEPQAPLALYNAAHNYRQAGDRAQAAQLGQRLLDRYEGLPDGSLAAQRQLVPRTLSSLADHYRWLTDFEAAIGVLRRLHDDYPGFATDGFTTADQAFEELIRLQLALGHGVKAAEDLRRWLDDHPGDPRRHRHRDQLAGILRQLERPTEALDTSRELASDPRAIEEDPDAVVASYRRIGEISTEQGHDAEALVAYRRGRDLAAGFLAAGRPLERGSHEAAQIRWRLLLHEFGTYDATTLAADEAQARSDLKDKHRAMEQLRDEFLELSQDPDAGRWSVAAAWMAGRVVVDLYHDLMGAPCPGDLTATQCDAYLNAKQVIATEQYLIPTQELYGRVMEGAAAAGRYDRHTVEVRQTLEQNSPAEYPPSVERYPTPCFLAPAWREQPYAR